MGNRIRLIHVSTSPWVRTGPYAAAATTGVGESFAISTANEVHAQTYDPLGTTRFS
jgi:hypothetical protein